MLLPSPLRTARKPFGLCRSSLSQGPSRNPVGQAPHLHDTGLGLTSVTRRRPHQQASCRHLLCLPSQLFRRSRAETPEGSQPAFAEDDLARRLNPYPSHYGAAFACSLLLYPPPHRHRLTASLPRREGDGLTTFHGHISDGLGSACSPVARQRRQGKGNPLYLATYLLVQASQRFWLVSSHDVYQQFTWVSHAIDPGPRPP